MNNNLLKKLLSFTISFCTGLFLITYLLKLPNYLSNNNKIVTEYYKDNYLTNVPLDYLFVLIYLLIAEGIINKLKIKNIEMKLLIVAITTCILTGGFCYYFNAYKMTTNFFSRWFHTVGYISIVYDVILLLVIYSIYLYLQKYIN